MDWKYLFSLSPDNLSDNEKDKLFNTITFYDFDDEELNSSKYKMVLKISQEIMKFKGEQVEALFAELDDLAAKQAEEEAEIKSAKSRKSAASFDQDDYEMKIRNLKTKIKQLKKVEENQRNEIETFKKQVASLQRDKVYLQNELKSDHYEDSQSDISETVKDQYKVLIETVHEKNKQISQLLNDIEMLEKDNTTLRDKLSVTSDELGNATKDISALNNEILSITAQLDEKSNNITKLNAEIINLKDQIADLNIEQENKNKEIEVFVQEIDGRIDEWKKILEEKNKEISELKSLKKTTSISSSSILENIHFDNTQIDVLNITIKEQEKKIIELQKQLVEATKEMEETTKLINNLLLERKSNTEKQTEQSTLVNNYEKELLDSQNVIQELEESITNLKKIVADKDKHIREILTSMKKNGQEELANLTQQLLEKKKQIMLQENHIMSLVQSSNKLQTAIETYDLENASLREQLGLTDEDYVPTKGILAKRKKDMKIMKKLQLKVNSFEEENISLKLKIQELNKAKQMQKQGSLKEEKIEKRNIDEVDDGLKDRYKELVDENEALRKGLHEIMDTLKKNNGNVKLESESFKKLLRALDVKHISGWYHPAMRLQVEVHNLEGVNDEIRSQLESTRKELNDYKKKFAKLGMSLEDITDLKAIDSSKLINEDVAGKIEYFGKEYSVLTEQIKLLYKQYEEEKTNWSDKENKYVETQNESMQKIEVLERQLLETKNFVKLEDDVKKLQKLNELSESLVVLNRKSVYLENSEKSLREEVSNLRNDLKNAELSVIEKMSEMNEEKINLMSKIDSLENKLIGCINYELSQSIQADLEKLRVENRDFLKQLNKLNENHKTQLDHLNKEKQYLHEERLELTEALKKALSNKYSGNDDALSKKLAEVEVAEITERQRANHINNLYELVKEQLRNSEERFTDYENFSKELFHKNLLLQETIKQFEDKVVYNVEMSKFNELQKSSEMLIKEKEKLMIENNQLQKELSTLQEQMRKHMLWSSSQEYEFLSLKHQIVDLQSASDDKAVIARLGSDVVHARLLEASAQKKLEEVVEELKITKEKYNECSKKLEAEKSKFDEIKSELHQKNNKLCEIIQHSRKNFYGFIPYISESKFIENMYILSNTKHKEFLSLKSIQENENEIKILKEQLNVERQILKNSDEFKDDKIDKNNFHLQELKLKRQIEFKESQLKQALDYISEQEQQIFKLEEELFKAFQLADVQKPESPKIVQKISSSTEKVDKEVMCQMVDVLNKVSKSVQTLSFDETKDDTQIAIITNLEKELKKYEEQLAQKDVTVQDFRTKITELEMNISTFRTQIGDKQSQIKFYEKYILELQNKKESSIPIQPTNDEKSEEIISLKTKIAELQEKLRQRDVDVVQFQTLLKKDRDEHSLAAARMQEEMKRLHCLLTSQNQALSKFKESKTDTYPSKAIIEQYFQQVHALEKHSCDIHISMQQLTEQLQVVKEESESWKKLAETRLEALQKLEDMIQLEVDKKVIRYKQECEKWQNEVTNLKTLMQQCRNETSNLKSIKDILKDKENKIHELHTTMRQMKLELKKQQESPLDSHRMSELESENEQLKKDIQASKKKMDQIIKKDQSLREEIRNLKGQLIKKPVLSARSDRTDSSLREQNLQKKVINLEEENKQLKNQLEKQLTINEAHRLKVAEDFDKWNKMKHFQQTAEKFKAKLKAKEEEFDKLHHTCSGYRVLIERLEREKHGLEARVKTLKSNCPSTSIKRMEYLETENLKLRSELEMLASKFEIQHHHAGGLGAAMLQDKLESQERKIAVLELSAKGTGEIRAEMERLQNSISSLQKANLRLEAENLELNLDMQKMGNDAPHLREQIQYLENYIEVLKAEKGSLAPDIETVDTKKISELERTVFVLKRLVEKLQAENKRLQGDGRRCTNAGRTASEEKLRGDLKLMKEQHGESMKKIGKLENELVIALDKIKTLERQPLSKSYTDMEEELSDVKSQLCQKSELLEKVKILLQRAAAKEKALLEEVAALRLKISR